MTLAASSSFPSKDPNASRYALNCIRVLTRILPFLYEKPMSMQECILILWSNVLQPDIGPASPELGGMASPTSAGDHADLRREKPYLGEELLDTLVQLLFFVGFTLPRPNQNISVEPRVKCTTWEKGVGCTVAPSSTSQIDSNRAEILRLLHTLCSTPLYSRPAEVLDASNHALDYLVSSLDKQETLTILCSFINTALRPLPSLGIPYEQMLFKRSGDVLKHHVLQLLPILLLRQPPDQVAKNQFRYYLSRIHKDADLKYLCQSLQQELQASLSPTNSLNPFQSRVFHPVPIELLSLFLEIWQSVKRFRHHCCDNVLSHAFLNIFFAIAEDYDSVSKQSTSQLACLCIQAMTAEPLTSGIINQRLESSQYHTIGNLLVTRICGIVVRCNNKLDPIIPPLLASIYNVAPLITDLTASSCMLLLKIFDSVSSPSFLLSNELHRHLLISLLESFNIIVDYGKTGTWASEGVIQSSY